VLRFDAPRIDAASARAAHFHGLQLVAASRIAVPFGESIKSVQMVEIGFLPSEVDRAAQIRWALGKGREGARWLLETAATMSRLFSHAF